MNLIERLGRAWNVLTRGEMQQAAEPEPKQEQTGSWFDSTLRPVPYQDKFAAWLQRQGRGQQLQRRDAEGYQPITLFGYTAHDLKRMRGDYDYPN